ncbi:PKD domain-containing protein [Rufibacter sediminis]|uniref:Gliding motility-associated C-terminal domain-containing protein n=1 Tax=Rufibacter sediminis TaxID=2762756 RepID=A0ABR6VP97_9BACT|nr:PKD domain-containing protein [Rufibacter sediminis]MBC3538747.1 gliding motility-associated C-terminal domain-containing protein [Rufibacter sediminis]
MPQPYSYLKFIFLFSLFHLFAPCSKALAQSKRANNWYFSDYAGINFNLNPPTPAFGGQVHSAIGKPATISDESGNLLFYTNGHSVWNKNHVQMPNGFGLTKEGAGGNTQTSVIIPKPGSSNLYYIFTTNPTGTNVIEGFYYALVDISLQNGLGDVTQKNIALQQNMNVGLTAVQHANGRDYWVICHPWESSNYLSYKVTSEGVSLEPVVSKGTVNQTWWTGWTGGQLKTSPDGAWLASVAENGIELSKFSTHSGKLENPFIIVDTEVTYNSFRGVEFSPNSNVLYASSLYEGFFQFDLTKETQNGIIESLKRIREPQRNISEELQLAPDGKIYVGKGGGDMDGGLTIGIINNPNSLTTSNKFNQDAMHLQGLYVDYWLPNFITSYLAAPAAISYSNICLGETTAFSAAGIGSRDSIRWFFSDPSSGSANTSTTLNSDHTFTSPGTYKVSLRVYLGGSYKELEQQVTIKEKPLVNLGPDIKVCSNEKVELDAGEGTPYLWSTGETTRKLIAKVTGDYWVEVSNGFCAAKDEIKVEITPLPIVNLGPDQQLCSTSPITLSVGSNNQEYKILWSTGEVTPTITVQESGLYWAEVTNEFCKVKDEIQVSFTGLTDLLIKASSTSPKHGETISLEATGDRLTSFRWDLGDGTSSDATTPFHTYEFAGTYPITLTAYNDFGCTAEASTEVVVAPYIFIPNIFTPNGDGKNEAFQITYNGRGPFDIKIFNRWGKQVYQAQNKDFKWDGSGYSDGVYYYLINSETGTYKGFVEMIH